MPTTAPQIEFHVQGLEPLAARLRQMGTRGQITLNELLRNILGVLVPIVRQLTPRRKGKLANSTVGQIIRSAGEQLLEIRQAARTPDGAFYGQFVREGTRPHVIRPRRPDGVLRFTAGSGEIVFTREVHHPGTAPNPYHRRALAQADPRIQGLLRQTGEKVARFIAGRAA